MSAEENKSRVLELIERVMNGHDANALAEFTSNPAVLGAAQGLLHAFPDLEANVQWIVAENDTVVAFHSLRGTQQGPWLFVQEPVDPRPSRDYNSGHVCCVAARRGQSKVL